MNFLLVGKVMGIGEQWNAKYRDDNSHQLKKMIRRQGRRCVIVPVSILNISTSDHNQELYVISALPQNPLK